MSPSYVGIDVGASRLHAVKITRRGEVLDAQVFAADDRQRVIDFCANTQKVAIDSPDRWSDGRHTSYPGISTKFSTARCAEVSLGHQEKYWVPWVTPMTPEPGSWIDNGIGLFQDLRTAGHDCIEVYPYAVYCHLLGSRKLPKKTSLAGIVARVTLLEGRGIHNDYLAMWSHDSLDAAVAALVAADPKAKAVQCDCGRPDGSAMWLPRAS